MAEALNIDSENNRLNTTLGSIDYNFLVLANGRKKEKTLHEKFGKKLGQYKAKVPACFPRLRKEYGNKTQIQYNADKQTLRF
ncbi:MAG: hypothetical protein R6V32_10445 [Bacteroidales bacterium]